MTAYETFKETCTDTKFKKPQYNKYCVILNLIYMIKHILILHEQSIEELCMYDHTTHDKEDWTSGIHTKVAFAVEKKKDALKEVEQKDFTKITFNLFRKNNTKLLKHFQFKGRSHEDKGYELFPNVASEDNVDK